MIKRVTVAEAETQIVRLIAEVAESDDEIVIERQGHPLATLIGTKASEQTMPTEAPRGALVLLGADDTLTDQDIDDLVANIYARRDDDQRRPITSPE